VLFYVLIKLTEINKLKEMNFIMSSYFSLTLDTTSPSSPSISILNGATYATVQLITCTLGTSDGATTGYQMKIWGDVDIANDANVQDTEAKSAWITFVTSKQIKLSSNDGNKTLYLKIRDDVYNESAQASDTITLDTTIPTVTITGSDVSKISKQTNKDTCSFSFTADVAIIQYKVCYVAASNSTQDTGTIIPNTAGSTNMSGNSVEANTPVSCVIKGADLETASSGDGIKCIKVFVQDSAGNWSV
jgi:hypothetical protein